jgi:serine/threonine protein kinase
LSNKSKGIFTDKMAYLVGLSQHIEFSQLPGPTDRFELQVLIGEGTYGEVFAAKDKQTGKKVAVKVRNKSY